MTVVPMPARRRRRVSDCSVRTGIHVCVRSSGRLAPTAARPAAADGQPVRVAEQRLGQSRSQPDDLSRKVCRWPSE
jgi:hypothetical protein